MQQSNFIFQKIYKRYINTTHLLFIYIALSTLLFLFPLRGIEHNEKIKTIDEDIKWVADFVKQESRLLLGKENIRELLDHEKNVKSCKKNNTDKSIHIKEINQRFDASISLDFSKSNTSSIKYATELIILRYGESYIKEALYRLFLTCNKQGIKIKDVDKIYNVDKIFNVGITYRDHLIQQIVNKSSNTNRDFYYLFSNTDCNLKNFNWERYKKESQELDNFCSNILNSKVKEILTQKPHQHQKEKEYFLYRGTATRPSYIFTFLDFNKYFNVEHEISTHDKLIQKLNLLGFKNVIYKLFSECSKHKIYIKDINEYAAPLLKSIIENSEEPEEELRQLFDTTDFNPNSMGIFVENQNCQLSHFHTLLHFLSIRHKISKPIDIFPIVKLFLEKGADLNIPSSFNGKNSMTPFAYLITWLQEAENSVVKEERPPKKIPFLSSSNNQDLIHLLFQYKADPNTQTESDIEETIIGLTPFHRATYSNSPYINIFLNNGADPTIATQNTKQTPWDCYKSHCDINLKTLQLFKEKTEDPILLKKINHILQLFQETKDPILLKEINPKRVQMIHQFLFDENFNTIPTLLKIIGVGNIQEEPDDKGSSLINNALTFHARACNQKRQAQYNTKRLDSKKKTLEDIIDLFIEYKANPYFYAPEGALPYEVTDNIIIRDKILDAIYNFIYEKNIKPIETFLLCLKHTKKIAQHTQPPRLLRNEIINQIFLPTKLDIDIMSEDMKKFKEAIDNEKKRKIIKNDIRIYASRNTIASLFVKWDIYNPETKRTFEIK